MICKGKTGLGLVMLGYLYNLEELTQWFFPAYFHLRNENEGLNKSDDYWKRENALIFNCLEHFGLMKFCENGSILNTTAIKFSATTPILFSKKYRQEGHRRIKRHNVPLCVK